MPVQTLPANMTIDDYEAIEGAVMETVRGRWFLMEFARRSRARELSQIGETLARLERAMGGGQRATAAAPPPRPDPDYEELSAAEWAAGEAFDADFSAIDALPIRDKIALFA